MVLITLFYHKSIKQVKTKCCRFFATGYKSKTECLDKILAKLNTGVEGGKPFNLAEDFDLACELGYGQFIWQSANYLSEPNSDTNASAAQPATD